jgi:hypothetical protein
MYTLYHTKFLYFKTQDFNQNTFIYEMVKESNRISFNTLVFKIIGLLLNTLLCSGVVVKWYRYTTKNCSTYQIISSRSSITLYLV